MYDFSVFISCAMLKFSPEIKSDDQPGKPDHFALEHKHAIFREFFKADRMQAIYGGNEVKK